MSLSAGWNLKSGNINLKNCSEDYIWSKFNYVFSDSSRKRNTYKFGLIKAILDNLFNMNQIGDSYFLSYISLFEKFSQNYWNLIVKYKLKQMRPDGKSVYSKIEQIFQQAVKENRIIAELEFESLNEDEKNQIIQNVLKVCKRNVVGALYNDVDGVLYGFDLAGDGLYIGYDAYCFMLKYKSELERLNYYSWAKFLEKVNDDNALIRVIDKLELSTPKRSDLSIYREILRKEFEENTCFYCGKKLSGIIHVDHFIPWSYVKDDKMWNFVLACNSCNCRKNNKIPSKDFLIRILERNKKANLSSNNLVVEDFRNYDELKMKRLWKYSQLSGYVQMN